MLMRFDPFRELDRLTQNLGGIARPGPMPMDAYRHGDEFVVHFDLPGLEPSSIELTVEQNVLTVSGERSWQPADDVEVIASERPQGRFTRQLFLGESLEPDQVVATYEHGVLTLTVPVSERAKPRRVEIRGHAEQAAIGTGARGGHQPIEHQPVAAGASTT
jgi:HSP20 family protein